MKRVNLLLAWPCCVLVSFICGQSRAERPAEPTTFIEAFPAPVYYLFQWPGVGVTEIQSDAPEVKYPKQYAADWIKRVLDEKWLPPEGVETICLQKEIDGRDTIRVKWDHDGCRVEASQTASILALKFTPLDKKGTGETFEQRSAFAQDLAKQVFADETFMWPLRGGLPEPRIPIKRLKERIVSFSFDPAQIKELAGDKLVVGYEKSKTGLGIIPSTDYVEDAKSDDPVLSTWQARYYWFRNVRWWNDGKSVGFYFLKLHGVGPAMLSYVGKNTDANWFHPPQVPRKSLLERRRDPEPAN